MQKGVEPGRVCALRKQFGELFSAKSGEAGTEIRRISVAEPAVCKPAGYLLDKYYFVCYNQPNLKLYPSPDGKALRSRLRLCGAILTLIFLSGGYNYVDALRNYFDSKFCRQS